MIKKIPLTPGWFLLLMTIGLLVIFAASLQISTTAIAQTEDNPETEQDTTSNEYCFSCHQEPLDPVFLPSGEGLFIKLDPNDYARSTHYRNEVTCIQCHKEITGFPHPIKTAQTMHEFQLQQDQACIECHEDEVSEAKDSLHGTLLEQGDQKAPTCSNCHSPHTQAYMIELTKTERSLVCANCHDGIYGEYAQSVHGSSMINENNNDVPGCIDCHGAHTMLIVSSPKFRNNSVYMCSNCHTNGAIMDKYGLSTLVLDTYLADFHGSTVFLIEKTQPDQETNKAVCYDCHGIHNILSVNDPEKGLAIKQNMLIACQSCHPAATANFTDSWLSHNIPNKNKFPIVYYVTLLYQILIPVVLIGMAVFVLSDIYRRLKTKFYKPKPALATSAGEEVESNDG